MLLISNFCFSCLLKSLATHVDCFLWQCCDIVKVTMTLPNRCHCMPYILNNKLQVNHVDWSVQVLSHLLYIGFVCNIVSVWPLERNLIWSYKIKYVKPVWKMTKFWMDIMCLFFIRLSRALLCFEYMLSGFTGDRTGEYAVDIPVM